MCLSLPQREARQRLRSQKHRRNPWSVRQASFVLIVP